MKGRKAEWRRKYVEGLVVNGVVYEDVLFLVDRQEVPTVTVLDQAAIGDLDVF